MRPRQHADLGRDRPDVVDAAAVLKAGLDRLEEREALGRRVVPRVPRYAGPALCVALWLPGGARGLALVAFHAALVTLFVLVAQAMAEPGPFLADGMAAYLAALLYLAVYLGLPSAAFARATSSPVAESGTRIWSSPPTEAVSSRSTRWAGQRIAPGATCTEAEGVETSEPGER